jgi:phenylacetate-coenzyme A ligase PaaK-like adenylate-forming protein
VSYNFVPEGSNFINSITEHSFEKTALSVFACQYRENKLYQTFVRAMGVQPERITRLTDIPFLPVSFFKTHAVRTGTWEQPAQVFESSKTTGDLPGRHEVRDEGLYKAALLHGFQQFYGSVKDYAILALLPSYIERGNASLVYMAQVLMQESGHPANGFYLDEWAQLQRQLQDLEVQEQKTLLLGVTYALLDFAAAYPMPLKHTLVLETGGMKGRRAESTRQEVHDLLKQQWHLPNIHSEYGMTELLSQAYALRDGIFTPSPTMRMFVRDLHDPLDVQPSGAGCLNVIDLANVHSCSFIATEDIGRLYPNGTFEVIGRMDFAALRGCNLMVW